MKGIKYSLILPFVSIQGTFRVYPLSAEEGSEALPETVYRNLPSTDPVECIVRLYVVKVRTNTLVLSFFILDGPMSYLCFVYTRHVYVK